MEPNRIESKMFFSMYSQIKKIRV